MIFFFYGPNSFSASEKTAQLKEKFLKEIDATGNSLAEIDASRIDAKELSQKTQTSSLFAQKRMIVIDGILSNKQETVIDIAQKLLENNRDNGDIIIFRETVNKEGLSKLKGKTKTLFQSLAQEKYAQEFSVLEGIKLSNWVNDRLMIKKIKISRQALTYLCDLETDLWRLNGIINQLTNFCRESGEIKIDNIKEFLEEKYISDIFRLTEAMGAQKKNEAIKILEEQLSAGLAEEYILAMAFKHFDNLMKIKISRENGLNPSSLGLHPFVVKKGLLQADKFSRRQLNDILNKLVLIEKHAKTGRGDIRTELILAIAES